MAQVFLLSNFTVFTWPILLWCKPVGYCFKKLNKDILSIGCRAEAVAPTKEGYKRKTGTKATQ